jgi:ABC-type transport system involved in multi-copper enzyme maturation permease subunit
MKTLIRKELRENFKLAVIGLVIFAFILVQEYRNCVGVFASLALGQMGVTPSDTQPLLSPRILPMVGLFCGVFGAILGWIQINNERHRDLWAFLIHRPLPSERIFLGKVVAGIALYALATVPPLLGLIVMVRIPGHIAAPFEWAMVLPITGFFLSGIVCYFAGLLTGLRQARWYASRGLGLGVGLIVSLAVMALPDFWRVLIAILVGAAIVAAAAWSSFLANGRLEGQPKWGRRSLTVSLLLGWIVVVIFVTSLLQSLLPQNAFDWISYRMAKDGTIYKMTQSRGQREQITDLNGKPVKDPKTGLPITQTDFYRTVATEQSLTPYFKDQNHPETRFGGYQHISHFYSIWHQTPDTVWYWNRNGRLWGYDLASRRFIGSLGPNGFAPGRFDGAGHFNPPENRYGDYYFDWSYPAKTLTADSAVYQLDLENRTVKNFLTGGDNDPVGQNVDVSLNSYDWNYTIVVTKKFIRLMTPDDSTVWQLPYQPAYPAYNSIQISFLEPTNKFAVWFTPNYNTNQMMGWKLPTHIIWVATGQGVLKDTDLPTSHVESTASLGEQLFATVTPPVAGILSVFIYGFRVIPYIPWKEILFALAGAVVCIGFGWRSGRKYHFTGAAQLKWAVFHLLFGLPGLLTFFCVQEWPAREPCPKCNKLRLVDREKCEYCGADFAPPPRNGTEIFESTTGIAAN